MHEGTEHLETLISWDIGQAQDYSGITVVQGIRPYHKPDFNDRVDHPIQYHIGPIERLPLGTDYRLQRKHILNIWEDLKSEVGLNPYRGMPRPVILMDISGVGRGIWDEIRGDTIREDINPTIYGIQWTAGHEVTRHGGIFNVPKNDAIQALIIAAQNGEIKIRSNQFFAPELKSELRNFRRKVTAAGNDTYEAAKTTIHDDLVMSVAQAVWFIRQRHSVTRKPRALPTLPYNKSFYARRGSL